MPPQQKRQRLKWVPRAKPKAKAAATPETGVANAVAAAEPTDAGPSAAKEVPLKEEPPAQRETGALKEEDPKASLSGAATSSASEAGVVPPEESPTRKRQEPPVIELPSTPRETLLKDLRGLLHFLWVHDGALGTGISLFDRSDSEICSDRELLAGAAAGGQPELNFDDFFDFARALPVTHVVHGRAGSLWSDVTSTWLRMELPAATVADSTEVTNAGDSWNPGPMVTYHGTRWPKLPFILRQGQLRSGPREAGGHRGVWSSPSFKVAETYSWPEPLAGASKEPWIPWNCEAPSDSEPPPDRFQVVLELEIQEWKKHARH
ncbi:unnamed protein product, partial [Symbiodinium sp. CCMP2456]